MTGEPGGGAASGKPRVRAVFQQETGADGKPINPFKPTKENPSERAEEESRAGKKSPAHQTGTAPRRHRTGNAKPLKV